MPDHVIGHVAGHVMGQTQFGHVTFPWSCASEVPESRFVTDCGWRIREFYCDLRGVPQKRFYWGDVCGGVGVVVMYCRGYCEPVTPIVL